jgi:transposase
MALAPASRNSSGLASPKAIPSQNQKSIVPGAPKIRSPRHAPNPQSERQKLLAKKRARRPAREERRQDLLQLVVLGMDYAEIASETKISLRTVRREVARAIDDSALELPHPYLRIQVQRLNKAVQAVADEVTERNLAAVDPLLKLFDKLDRYYGLAQLCEPVSRRIEPAAAAITAAPAPLALPGTEAGPSVIPACLPVKELERG